MKKLVFGSILLTSVFAFSAMAEEWTGFVGDAKCGAKHTGASAKEMACAKTCVKGGADPVFVVGDKVLKFDADSKDKAVAHAGEKVKVTGTLDGDTVKATSIEAAGM